MSRKKQVNQKITALYCRISLEDGGDNESMSISNQKLMLRDFAEKNGMFQYEYYVDDGYTGRNFNRPSFQRMIADIEAGKIGCVITKDLSSLGRNYIEAGSYIEIFFPKHNVRYIAITDGVDSLTRQEMDITPFKNILNDMYSRDISKKVLAGIISGECDPAGGGRGVCGGCAADGVPRYHRPERSLKNAPRRGAFFSLSDLQGGRHDPGRVLRWDLRRDHERREPDGL